MLTLIPQLAEPIPKERLVDYILDDRYYTEQKIDGHRKLVWLRNGVIEVLNRQGKPADLPADVFNELPTITDPEGIALDCELIGDELWVFDLPFAAGHVAPSDPYEWRRAVLDSLAPSLVTSHVRLLPTARTHEEKLAISRKVIENGGEGLMVKDSLAAYHSGLRHEGLLKAKFVKDVDAVITRFGIGLSSSGSGLPKSNCELLVFREPVDLTNVLITEELLRAFVRADEAVVIGECIIHPKERNIVDVGSVVTVAYLYCVDPDHPRLVQPTRIRPRSDKAPGECLLDQLRFTDKNVLT